MKPQVIASFGEEIYLNAVHRASRMEEFERHVRPINKGPKIHNSKKAYSRKPKHRSNLYDNLYEYDY